MRRSVLKCVLLTLLLLKLCPNRNEAYMYFIDLPAEASFPYEDEKEGENEVNESENDPEQYYPVHENMKGISDSLNQNKSDKEVNEEEGEQKKREGNEEIEEQEEEKEEEEEEEEEKEEEEEEEMEIGEEEEDKEREYMYQYVEAERMKDLQRTMVEPEIVMLEYLGLNQNDNIVLSGANQGKIDNKLSNTDKSASFKREFIREISKFHERKRQEEEEFETDEEKENRGEDEVAVKDLQFLPERLNLGLKSEEREANDCFGCWKTICKKDKNCVVSFDKSLSRCVGWKVRAQVVSWDENHRKLFINVKFEIESWVTIVVPLKIVEVPPPRLMWLINQMTEDTNLVQSEAHMLGLSTPPILTNLKAIMPYIRVSDKGKRFSMGLLDYDELQFNFSSPFTITTWIKTGFKGYIRIFDGISHGYLFLRFGNQSGDSSKFGVFKYEPTPKVVFTRMENNENMNSCRHISVVQRSLIDVLFLSQWTSKTVRRKCQNSI